MDKKTIKGKGLAHYPSEFCLVFFFLGGVFSPKKTQTNQKKKDFPLNSYLLIMIFHGISYFNEEDAIYQCGFDQTLKLEMFQVQSQFMK